MMLCTAQIQILSSATCTIITVLWFQQILHIHVLLRLSLLQLYVEGRPPLSFWALESRKGLSRKLIDSAALLWAISLHSKPPSEQPAPVQSCRLLLTANAGINNGSPPKVNGFCLGPFFTPPTKFGFIWCKGDPSSAHFLLFGETCFPFLGGGSSLKNMNSLYSQ